MDRRDVEKLSPEDFIEQYARQGKPVILFSSYEDPDSSSSGGSDLITGPAWQRCY
jgi:hypothetical protein